MQKYGTAKQGHQEKKSLMSIPEYFSRNNAIVKPQTPLPMSICLKKKKQSTATPNHRNACPIRKIIPNQCARVLCRV